MSGIPCLGQSALARSPRLGEQVHQAPQRHRSRRTRVRGGQNEQLLGKPHSISVAQYAARAGQCGRQPRAPLAIGLSQIIPHSVPFGSLRPVDTVALLRPRQLAVLGSPQIPDRYPDLLILRNLPVHVRPPRIPRQNGEAFTDID